MPHEFDTLCSLILSRELKLILWTGQFHLDNFSSMSFSGSFVGFSPSSCSSSRASGSSRSSSSSLEPSLSSLTSTRGCILALVTFPSNRRGLGLTTTDLVSFLTGVVFFSIVLIWTSSFCKLLVGVSFFSLVEAASFCST